MPIMIRILYHLHRCQTHVDQTPELLSSTPYFIGVLGASTELTRIDRLIAALFDGEHFPKIISLRLKKFT
jgi:hypothetical protein